MTETRPDSGPTVLRMILGRQLQALRENAGMSNQQAAEAIYSSHYTVRRMERAEGGLKPLTVKSLLMAYGITDVREIDIGYRTLMLETCQLRARISVEGHAVALRNSQARRADGSPL
jgi:transcriptional regulator with XRE-family HTH domain